MHKLRNTISNLVILHRLNISFGNKLTYLATMFVKANLTFKEYFLYLLEENILEVCKRPINVCHNI